MALYHRIDAKATTEEKTPVRAEKLIEGTPLQETVNQFTNEKGNFFVGVWASDAGKWNVSYTEDEFFTILEGEAILTEKGAEPQRLVSGDHMTVASGFKGTWETVGRVKKLYVIYED